MFGWSMWDDGFIMTVPASPTSKKPPYVNSLGSSAEYNQYNQIVKVAVFTL